MIELQPFHLKVMSSLLINVAAGFIVLAITTNDLRILTSEIFFAIVCILFAFKFEQAMEEIK
ncbi:MAG: hypothetical protein A2868_00650 [Candidatus Levybacteria bacterium RIFCSPHIGHO2_01_FULL_40_15b]|nr:MAG: hypothetical protein A2868_00650 [Candidatus Levybacteria bacterium RIFCSPHIGHO2_01_FULL_40_15b]